jgi:hypothetical protein
MAIKWPTSVKHSQVLYKKKTALMALSGHQRRKIVTMGRSPLNLRYNIEVYSLR